jgi:DoxX-like family
MAMNHNEREVARLSLVFVWLWTAAVSIQQADGRSLALLQQQHALPATLFPWVIWGGAGVDLALGVLMAWHPQRWIYVVAGGMTLLMTMVGTWLTPELWLDPLGCLSKNLPILVLLWLLARETSS